MRQEHAAHMKYNQADAIEAATIVLYAYVCQYNISQNSNKIYKCTHIHDYASPVHTYLCMYIYIYIFVNIYVYVYIYI